MRYEITDQVKTNLIAFLNRVDMKGSEVGAFLEVINALQNPIQEENESKNKDKINK